MDCARLIDDAGGHIILLQRSATTVVSIAFNTQGLCQAFPSEEYQDILNSDQMVYTTPYEDLANLQRTFVGPASYNQVDKAMIEGLQGKGFQTRQDSPLCLYLERFGGFCECHQMGHC